MLVSAVFRFASVGLFSSLVASAVTSPQHSEPVPPFEAAPLYHLNMTFGTSISFGPGPMGTRFSDPISGGSFIGPKMSGIVLPVGADWGLLDARGGFMAITVYQFQTDDGANIFVRSMGPTPNGRGLNYISLETGHENYYWLNNILVVGLTQVDKDKQFVTMDAWQLLPPSE